MKHLDLFSGIGGFALAARWMGWETIGFVEIDKFCQKVLSKNFPNIPIHGDIKTFNGESLRGSVDILTGGFPCQPFSSAGKRKGKEDARHLWPEMLRVIGEVQPSYIVGENVRGLLNWNKGMVFDEVQIDLENKGYQVAPFLLPACGVQAPHNRARIFIIAHLNSVRCNKSKFKWNAIQWRELAFRKTHPSYTTVKPITDTYSPGLSGRFQRWQRGVQIQAKPFKGGEYLRGNPENTWEKFPIESPICRGINGVSNRVDRIRGLGNAIVPQLVYQIYKAIELTQASYPEPHP